MENKGDNDANGSTCAWNCPQMVAKLTGRIWNKSNNQDHLEHNISLIS